MPHNEEQRPVNVDVVTLTRDELRQIMTEAIEQAFRNVGLDPHDPLAVQRDMAHLRRWRLAVDSASSTSMKAVITTLIAGVIGLIVLGFQNYVGK